MRLLASDAALPWVPPSALRQRLAARFSALPVDVVLVHRTELARTLPAHATAPAYAFRAVTTADGRTIVLADPTETPSSIAWLIAHEARHQEIRQDPALLARYQAQRPAGLDPMGDRFHALDPEEIDCDTTATLLVGQRLDRAWWRARQ